jgi:hypothetical protein
LCCRSQATICDAPDQAPAAQYANLDLDHIQPAGWVHQRQPKVARSTELLVDPQHLPELL